MNSNAARDPRERTYIAPARVVWTTDGAATPQGADSLLTLGEGMCILESKDGREPGLLLDFGRELHGGVQIVNAITPSHKPIQVRVRFGESVSEAMGNTDNDHAIHNTLCDIPWFGQTEIGNTGFRFVRLDLVEPNERLELKHVRAVSLMRPIEYQGSFECNDERLNAIWRTATYTVHCCMQDLVWDGIKRDRLAWIGDLHPETMVICNVFGRQRVVEETLDYVRDHWPLPEWMHGISSYSMWWVLVHHAWHRFHGDAGYLRKQRDYLLPLLKHLRTHIAEDGREQLTGGRFLDWPSSEDPGAIHVGLQALMTMTMAAGAELCDLLDADEEKAACQLAAEQLRRYAPPPSPRKVANAMLVLAGLADAEKTNRETLAANPLSDLSTFYGYYVLQARALAGDYTGALDVIRKYWGAMLDCGATTFWEDFQLEWTENAGRIDELVPPGKKDLHADFGNYCYKGLRHSFCHGWAGGPAAWLIEHVLGLAPVEPGCASVRVRPHLGDLEYASGSMATPFGPVKVQHRKRADGSVDTHVDAPSKVRIIKLAT